MMAETEERDEEPRDLGLGTAIGAEGGQRLLRRDGTFTVRREGLGLRENLSLYHLLLTMSWPAFLGLVASTFFVLNTAFATGYLLCDPDAVGGPGEHGFLRSFFFSVQTITTVGYGALYPASMAANVLATCELVVGVLVYAVSTGLVFARFSRPIADIVYSERALVAPYRGGKGLMIRIANRRRNQIIGLEARLILSRIAHGPSGATRSFHELDLERTRVSFFPLSWTIVHPIDEQSPLAEQSAEDLLQADAEIFILLNGMDETFSQNVHSRRSYTAEEIVWNARFGNIFQRASTGNVRSIDIARIHDYEPA